jgi:hypothetical protein
MTNHKITSDKQQRITILFGYTLFGLTALSFLLHTLIPFSLSFQYPNAKHFNIIIMIVVFGMAALLPALISYFIGDSATRSKSKTVHHYNGVLFGITAYWLAILLSWVGFNLVSFVSSQPYPLPLVVNNIIPIAITMLSMTALAIGYSKKQTKNSTVINYRPFQMVLLGSVVLGFLYPNFSGDLETTFMGIVSGYLLPALIIVVTAVAYMVLSKHHTTRLARLSDALIAMSMGWIATWLANAFIVSSLSQPMQSAFQVATIVSYSVGAVVIALYLYLRSR